MIFLYYNIFICDLFFIFIIHLIYNFIILHFLFIIKIINKLIFNEQFQYK